MKKSELQNLALLELRNGKRVRFVGNTFIAEDLEVLGEDFFDEDLAQAYGDEEEDVAKVYDDMSDEDTKLIWIKKEFNWNDVPIGTKVFVRNYDYEDWQERYFVKKDGNLFFTLAKNAITATSFRQCKLVKQLITGAELEKEIIPYCESKSCSEDCEYFAESDTECAFNWLLGNYSITRK